jgi:[ribosomal protein S5]-alanine N-acetyltransferase
MFITLQPVSLAALQTIAQTVQSNEVLTMAAEGGMPPPIVAKRSLDNIAAGKSEAWCSPFLIVKNADKAIVSGCGFKDEPCDGRVEIGYGVALIHRKQGVATAAVRALLDRAFLDSAVTEVLATINPANEASIGVVERIGFEKGALIVDSDGEELVHWHFRKRCADR